MREKIIGILRKRSGLRAKEIAQILYVDRRTINQILYYSNFGVFQRDDNYQWYLTTDPDRIEKSTDTDVKKAIKAINSIHGVVDYITENDSSLFYPENIPNAKFANQSEVIENVDFHIFTFCLDIYFGEDLTNAYVEEYDFDEIDMRIGHLLDNRYWFEDFEGLFSGFCTREHGMPDFLEGVARYDLRNQTNYGELIIRCFEIIGACLAEVFHSGSHVKLVAKQNEFHIDAMRNYINYVFEDFSEKVEDDERHKVDSNEDFAKVHQSSLINTGFTKDEKSLVKPTLRCHYCGESSITNLVRGKDGNMYCHKCILYMNGENKQTKKVEIEETCDTCRFRKDFSCNKAKKDFVCKMYEYYK